MRERIKKKDLVLKSGKILKRIYLVCEWAEEEEEEEDVYLSSEGEETDPTHIECNIFISYSYLQLYLCCITIYPLVGRETMNH